MNNTSAFAPSCALPISSASKTLSICASRPAPFFSSTAFASPLKRTIRPALANRGVRMEVAVVVGDSEPIEGALRRFKREVSKSGHLFELKRRRHFETNTEKRLRKAVQSRRKAKLAKNSKPLVYNGSLRSDKSGTPRTPSSL